MNDLCQIEPEIQFFRRGLRIALEINISQATCRRLRNSELFLEVKSKLKVRGMPEKL